MIAPPPDTKEIENALVRHGVRPLRLTLVSPLAERKGRRWAYRVESDDGRVVKARRFENEEAARRAFALHARLDDAFARALARDGAVLLEEWIDGEPLTVPDWDARAEEAAALLAHVHGKPLGRDDAASFQTTSWRDGATADLDVLRSAAKLTRAESAFLHEAVERLDPGESRAALLHLDFCADNMLVDRQGRLRIIDNELLTIGPIALDLARTFNLCPMSDSTWARFRSSYDAAAIEPVRSINFWRIVASLKGARIFLERNPTRLELSLSQLRRFAAGECLGDP